MKHKISDDDIDFLNSFEKCEIDAKAFGHKEHIRLAYILLVQSELDDAKVRLKTSLIRYLTFNGVDTSKYHETMTVAWLLAVKHFMHMSVPAENAIEFIQANDILLDKNIMYTHYSRDLMESDPARKEFIEPDLEPIPVYGYKAAG